MQMRAVAERTLLNRQQVAYMQVSATRNHATGGRLAVQDWSLITTRPNTEAGVAEMLKRLHIDHHLFKVRKMVSWRGTVIERLLPAFPRYIFVIPNYLWRAILEVEGVFKFVSFGESPALIPNKVIDKLVSASIDDVLPDEIVVPVGHKFKAGDRVRMIGDGVTAGHVGIYQHHLGYTQSIIQVDWMGRYIPICVDDREIELEVRVEVEPKRKRRNRDGWGRIRNIEQTVSA